MIIVLRSGTKEAEIQDLIDRLQKWGLRAHVSRGVEQTIVGAIGDERILQDKPLSALSYVEKVLPVVKPFRLVSREFQASDTIVSVGKVRFGGGVVGMIAGPCSVESLENLLESARFLKSMGVGVLRAGAFKPRSSPYAFQGLGLEALKYLKAAREETGLAIVTELMDARHAEAVADAADCIQIGARNMQNFDLLRAVGALRKPVLLKRGLSATIEEWLMSAEYILSEGNFQVILCERGIRTFEPYTRNTLDVSAVPVARLLSHLPVVVDPSHAAGRSELVRPLAAAALAAGADGLLVEVHPRPEEAVSDGRQSLRFPEFAALMEETGRMLRMQGRTLSGTESAPA